MQPTWMHWAGRSATSARLNLTTSGISCCCNAETPTTITITNKTTAIIDIYVQIILRRKFRARFVHTKTFIAIYYYIITTSASIALYILAPNEPLFVGNIPLSLI